MSYVVSSLRGIDQTRVRVLRSTCSLRLWTSFAFLTLYRVEGFLDFYAAKIGKCRLNVLLVWGTFGDIISFGRLCSCSSTHLTGYRKGCWLQSNLARSCFL